MALQTDAGAQTRVALSPAPILPAETLHTSVALEFALRYAAQRFRVFPVYEIENGKCSCPKAACSAGKHPRVDGWGQIATTDESTIRQWFTQWPNANIGIVTGGGRVVIDIDPDKGGNESLAALEKELGVLPSTLSVDTGGGGRHLIYTFPADCIIRNRTALGPGLDIRGDGGYVVAPPSNHISGGHYQWAAGCPAEPAQLPTDWLLKLRKRQPAEQKPSAKAKEETHMQKCICVSSPSGTKISRATEQQLACIIDEHIVRARGGRHEALRRLSAAFNRLPEVRNQPASYFQSLIFAWWDRSKDGGQVAGSWDETWADWVRMWERQNHSYRTPVEQALALARFLPPPPEAEQYDWDKMKLLVALCAQMQAMCDQDGRDDWFLGVRTIRTLLGISISYASKCLHRLCFDGVLEKTDAPERATRRAHSYRYIAGAGEQRRAA